MRAAWLVAIDDQAVARRLVPELAAHAQAEADAAQAIVRIVRP